MEHRLPLGQKEILVSSWLREGALIKDARYHCVAEASTGSDTSEVDLRLTIGETDLSLDGPHHTLQEAHAVAYAAYFTEKGPSVPQVLYLLLTEHCNV
ncbi:hypothetical protein KUCAC02_009371 [Chaenocephalus aceratus]|uniref:Uncharacterized protein n=1 Tax=Chaenocephalus aceratus TaxID=36190 RepID=A0ACB9WUU0_CHAAC|nr:hypothetical protein KUCAC02_009371 [Chaenocephalus aceratus]